MTGTYNNQCRVCQAELKPDEFDVCKECKIVSDIINQRIAKVKDEACEDVRRERAARKGL